MFYEYCSIDIIFLILERFTVPYASGDTLKGVKVKFYDECGIKPER